MPIPTRKLVWIALVALASMAAAQRPPSAAPPGPDTPSGFPFERYTLPNGLTVILSPDHTTPTVAVNVWYHVGSKNEVPGRTGFAHLFEHIMFTGSGHVPVRAPRQADRGGRRQQQRDDVERPHHLLRDRAVELPRVGAVDRVGPHGLPARHARHRQAQRAARHREERAPAGRGQPALREGGRDPRAGDLPGRPIRIRGT